MHQTMQQHLIPKKNTSVNRNPEFALLKNTRTDQPRTGSPLRQDPRNYTTRTENRITITDVTRKNEGGGKTRKLKTGRRQPYMVRLSNKYQMKLERSLGDGSGMDS